MKTIILLLVFALSPSAFGSGVHLKKMKKQYPNSKSSTCKACHSEGTQLNGYGVDYQAKAYDFVAIEGLDSDGDTFTNIDEINKDSNPGSKDSVPSSEL